MNHSHLLVIAAVAACSASSAAQCSTAWAAGFGQPGVEGGLQAATAWDPDGPGPATPRIAMGGRFRLAGDVQARQVAAFDPVAGTWSAIGSLDPAAPLNAVPGFEVSCIAAQRSGGLLVATSFPEPLLGSLLLGIKRWNGVGWSWLAVADGGVLAMLELPNGDLIAGGTFTSIGGALASRVARWNGSTWSALGSGADGTVHALALLPNGDVIAGGAFGNAGGAPAARIARWNGATWAPLATGANGTVLTLAVAPSGALLAGGDFTTAGGVPANRIASWNGASWSAFGGGFNDSVGAIDVDAAGTVRAGGRFTASGATALARVAQWSGTAWQPMGSGVSGELLSGSPTQGVIALLPMANGELFVGGNFRLAGTTPAHGAASWDGTTLAPLARGTDPGVVSFAVCANGDVVAVGSFSTIQGVAAPRVARWNGAQWSAVGTGLGYNGTSQGHAYAACELPNGDLVVGGNFDTAGGVAALNVAHWNGSAFAPLGAGLAGAVYRLVRHPNGEVLAAGAFAGALARWDGVSWQPITGAPSGVASMAFAANGDLIVIGSFTTAGGAAAGRVARWNGTAWSPLGAGVDGAVSTLVCMPSGDIYVGGAFQMLLGAQPIGSPLVARWNGSTWLPVGGLGNSSSHTVTALVAMPNGDVVASGSFPTALARWNGATWQPFAGGLGEAAGALAVSPRAELWAGGGFHTAGAAVSAHVARFTTTCPASAVTGGAGCASSGGANVLAATALAWTGGPFRARGTGLPAHGFALAVHGFGAISLPLAALLPQGQPGCVAHASPDLLDVVPIAAGVAECQLAIPGTPALAGLQLHHQLVPFELDAGGALVAVTATNALVSTVGTL